MLDKKRICFPGVTRRQDLGVNYGMWCGALSLAKTTHKRAAASSSAANRTAERMAGGIRTAPRWTGIHANNQDAFGSIAEPETDLPSTGDKGKAILAKRTPLLAENIRKGFFTRPKLAKDEIQATSRKSLRIQRRTTFDFHRDSVFSPECLEKLAAEVGFS